MAETFNCQLGTHSSAL